MHVHDDAVVATAVVDAADEHTAVVSMLILVPLSTVKQLLWPVTAVAAHPHVLELYWPWLLPANTLARLLAMAVQFAWVFDQHAPPVLMTKP